MKEYYEKKVKQAKLAKKLISNGIKKFFIEGAENNTSDLRSEDLFLYGDVLKDAEYSVEIAEKDLADLIIAQSYPAETVNKNA